MAVFGLQQLREDDALRAVRCAAEMKRALRGAESTSFAAHVGSHAREPDRRQHRRDRRRRPDAWGALVLGDAINVAARLEQAAPANEILLGPETYSLVRDAVEVEAVEPLELKGKAEPVAAYRLVSSDRGSPLGGGAPAARRPRATSSSAWTQRSMRALDEPACTVVTVIGEPGVGKTRLLEEFGQP